MTIAELGNKCPQWLRDVDTLDADVELTAWGRVVWHGGEWHGGMWRGPENRLLYHASLLGITFRADTAVAYRTTRANGHGRFTEEFVQPEGEYYEDVPPAGTGVCVPGIHVTSAARAHTYFGVDPTAQMWEVTFRREDLLDCDGEKARIRGGTFKRIPRPF